MELVGSRYGGISVRARLFFEDSWNILLLSRISVFTVWDFRNIQSREGNIYIYACVTSERKQTHEKADTDSSARYLTWHTTTDILGGKHLSKFAETRFRQRPVGTSWSKWQVEKRARNRRRSRKRQEKSETDWGFPINVQVTKYTCTKSEVSKTFRRFMAAYLPSYWKYIWNTWREFNTFSKYYR